ncbi:MAG: hypothetical protein ACK5M7_04425 [Draconibacterium sp.]
MDKFLKLLVDWVYRTNSKRKNFEAQHNEKVLAADASKGITTKQNDSIDRGAAWMVSQRAIIMLTNKRIICGKWDIPVEKISKASLVKIKSLFGGGQVLKIDTFDNESYQFGMQVNDEWINQTALQLTVENGKVKIFTLSTVVWILALGYLLYLLLQDMGVFAN